jgi:hypothetical protein
MEPVSVKCTAREAEQKLDDFQKAWGAELKVEEKHDLRGGPINTGQETFQSEERVENGRAETKLTTYRLDVLAKEYALFTFGPTYAGTGFPYDVVYQFGVAMQLDRVPQVVAYRAPKEIFKGLGAWDNYLQGIPLDLGDLFEKFVLNMVIPDSVARPKRYWRVNSRTLDLYTPGAVCESAPVRVFVPTGIDYRIEPLTYPSGVVAFSKQAAEPWVVEEAQRFFIGA